MSEIKARNYEPQGLFLPVESFEYMWEVITMEFILPRLRIENGTSDIRNFVWEFSKMIQIVTIKANMIELEVAIIFKEYV